MSNFNFPFTTYLEYTLMHTTYHPFLRIRLLLTPIWSHQLTHTQYAPNALLLYIAQVDKIGEKVIEKDEDEEEEEETRKRVSVEESLQAPVSPPPPLPPRKKLIRLLITTKHKFGIVVRVVNY